MDTKRQHLRLLGVLDALLAERNVTRAAERLHLSQPAVSTALAQLRELFQDPLLVRHGKTLVLTPRAATMKPKLDAVLGLVDGLMSDLAFDPGQVKRQFAVAVSDAVGQQLMPAVVARLHQASPGVSLRLSAAPVEFPTQAMAHGELDLLISNQDMAKPGMRSELLYQQDLCVVMRKGHPAFKRHQNRMKLRDFAAHPHVTIFPFSGLIEHEFHRVFTTARAPFVLQASTQHASVAAGIVAHTDALTLLPRKQAAFFGQVYPLQAVTPPLEMNLPPTSAYMVWHERSTLDPASAWLRGIIGECAAATVD